MGSPPQPILISVPSVISCKKIMQDYETTAAAARATAITRDTLGHFWHGQPLQPWTARREILFLALEAAAAQSNDLIESIANNLDYLPILEAKLTELLEQQPSTTVNHGQQLQTSSLLDYHRFLPAATRVLWLAHHTPDQWSHLRADPPAWLEQIEVWGDAHILDHDLEHAVRLAHLLRTEHRQFITIPRPEKHAPRTDAGN